MVVLGLLGAAALVGGLVLAVRRSRDVVTRGEVVAVRTVREGGPVLVHHLTVAFRDVDGEDVRADVRTRAALAPGATVTLRYRPGDAARPRPEVLRTDVALLGAGVLLLAAAVVPPPAGFLLAGGGLFAAMGGYLLRPLLGGVKVRGTVVRVDTRRDDDGDLLHRPVVRFFDRDERERVVEYDVWTNGRSPQVGAPQLLWYRPQDPGRILLGSGMVLGGVMAGVGTVLAAVALGILLLS